MMRKCIPVFLLLIGGFLFQSQAQTTAPTADAVLKKAYAQAGKEHKKVFLIFHASWCGWCHRMDSLMASPACKKFFDDNYVITHLTVMESEKNKYLENEGAAELMEKYHGKGQGIPFWLVLDANGNLLADALIKPEEGPAEKPQNSGCPATEEEVSYFIRVLKATSSLTKDNLSVIATTFKKGA